MMLKAVLIDDDQSNLDGLQSKLTKHCPRVEVAALCTNGAEGIHAIETLKPDIVFLDIEMPVMNGFVMLQQLEYRDFELIFVTAYDHYAIKAIRYSAMDYLVKPVIADELVAAVEKAEAARTRHQAPQQMELLLEMLQTKTPRLLTIPSTDGLKFINIEEIAHLEASNNYTVICLTGNRKFLVSRTLKDFEDLLPRDRFVRIHQSYIINKYCIDRYIRGEGGQVVLNTGVVLDVAKRKKTEFLTAMGYH